MDEYRESFPPGTCFGPYALTRRLGEGGMGAVYEAVHRELQKRVAIKIVRPELARSEEVRARFLREGRAAARVRHPNVADVYDVGVERGTPFMVLELLEGESLAQRLAREGPLPLEQAADLLVPIAAALATAHDLGIVHRDIKPDNIFVSQERSGVRPRLLDFGISKLLEGDALPAFTRSTAVFGTPHYMSPEQAISSKSVEARSDQYSLGAVLYECVTGKRPFDADTIYALIHKIVHGEFAAPRTLNAQLPEEAERIVLQAMSREPRDRFVSVRAFGRALLAFSGDRTRLLFTDEFPVDGSEQAAPVAPGPTEPVENGGVANTTRGEQGMRLGPRRLTRVLGVVLATASLSTALAVTLLRWRAPALGGVAPALSALSPATAALRGTPTAPSGAAASPSTSAALAGVTSGAAPAASSASAATSAGLRAATQPPSRTAVSQKPAASNEQRTPLGDRSAQHSDSSKPPAPSMSAPATPRSRVQQHGLAEEDPY